MKKILFMVAVLAIIGSAGYAAFTASSDTTNSANTTATTVDSTASKQKSRDKTPGEYTTYSTSKISKASTGSVVLFFNAKWCPHCQEADKNIKADRNKIPSNVTILSVDYDSNPGLKQKYGVTYQHTFVQVDANGNELEQWSGSRTLDDILGELGQ